MTKELKEKMQKAAKKLCAEFKSKFGAGSNLRVEDIAVWIQETFEEGAEAMHNELAPLVEWVSVEERLPETGKIVLLKNDLEDISTGCFSGKIFKIDFDEISSKKVTHWRRIEL